MQSCAPNLAAGPHPGEPGRRPKPPDETRGSVREKKAEPVARSRRAPHPPPRGLSEATDKPDRVPPHPRGGPDKYWDRPTPTGDLGDQRTTARREKRRV